MRMILDYGGITESNFETYQVNAMANLNWQSENIEAIEVFFGYSETSTVISTTVEVTTQGGASVGASMVVLVGCLVARRLIQFIH